jgi:hypothetical protein
LSGRLAASLAVLAGLLGGCTLADFPAGASPGPVGSPTLAASASQAAPASGRTVEPSQALAQLSGLRVAGRGPMTGYRRADFGPAWEDTDRNGCDTRNDVLRRDLTDVRLKPGTHGCVVLTGTLRDPYSGRTMVFQRGQGTSELVQIDHVVSLGDAWQTGAAQWSDPKRVAFANDPLNLLAVDGDLNQQKGDADAASWLPPNRGFWCQYATRQVRVKAAYGLSVTAAEKAALTRALATCPA